MARRSFSESTGCSLGTALTARGHDERPPHAARPARARPGRWRIAAVGLTAALLASAPRVLAAPKLYVPSFADGTVSVIDSATDTVIGTIALPGSPLGIAVAADGTRAFVTSFNGTRRLSVIDTATDTVVAAIDAPSIGAYPTGVAVSPDGARVLVLGGQNDNVLAYDAQTLSFVAGDGYFASFPYGIAISPGGESYVTNRRDVGWGKTLWKDSPELDGPNQIARLSDPYGVAVTSDETKVYVADGTGNRIAVYDSHVYPPLKFVAVGADAYGVATSPDSRLAVATNRGSDSLSVLRTADDTVVATVTLPAGAAPAGVSVHPDGVRAYVVGSGSGAVYVVDLEAATVRGTIPVGAEPYALGQMVQPLCITDDDCDDGVACTADACDGGTRVCSHVRGAGCPTPAPTPTPTPAATTTPVATATPDPVRSLTLERARLRPATRAGHGRVAAAGDLAVDAGGAIDASQGFAVRLRDAAPLDLARTWSADECTTRTAAVVCKSTDRTASLALRAVRRSAPLGPWKFKLTMSRLGLPAALAAPISLELVQPARSIDRTGELGSCRQVGAGLVCP